MASPRHKDELKALLSAEQIRLDTVYIVGGGILAVKDVRTNNDIDFFTSDQEIRNRFYKDKTHEKYSELTPNVDCYFDRYRELGMSDEQIVKEGYFFECDGLKYVAPEIEVAYKLLVKNIDEKRRMQLETYMLTDPNWNWNLFKELVAYYNDNKPRVPYWKQKMRDLRIVFVILRKEPMRLYRHVSKVVRKKLHFELLLSERLRGQLRTKMPTAALFGNHSVSNDDFWRYDVLLRYLTVGAILNDDQKILGFYKEMQLKRKSSDTTTDFKRLVHSIKESGFSTDYPIPVSPEGRLIEGAHRLASALYFKIEEVPVEVIPRNSGGYYGRKWFTDNCFSDELIELLDACKQKLFLEQGLYFPVMVWSPAEAEFASIAKRVRSKHKVVYEGRLNVEGSFSNFLAEIYAIDNIAKWKVGLKQHLMQKHGGFFYLMLLEVSDPAFRAKPRYHSYLSKEMESLKRDIRKTYRSKVSDYFYDIIVHTGDNYFHNRKIMEVLYNYTKLDIELLS